MWDMAVMRNVSCRRGSVRKLALWILFGFCVFSVRYGVNNRTTTPADGREEKREMMDGNDDGKMMGGVDNEGESESEINEKLKNEDEPVMGKGYDGDGDDGDDGKREMDEYNDHSVFELTEAYEEGNYDDGDAETNNVEEEEPVTKMLNSDAEVYIYLDGEKFARNPKKNPSSDFETSGRTELETENDEEERKDESTLQNWTRSDVNPDADNDIHEEQIKVEDNNNAYEENRDDEEEKEQGGEGQGKRLWEPPLNLNGNYAPNETLKGRPVVKVLLLAYQRSGSSFAGELLSSGGGALYVYEPLFPWRHHFGTNPDPAFHEGVNKLLGDLLDCHPQAIDAWKKMKIGFFKRKPKGVKDFCKDAFFRVLKTIRARASYLLPWLLQREDVKVVHLVRDPRGILNSVRQGGNIWTDRNRDAEMQCANIKNDLSLEQLGTERYLRVRYEDLVEMPSKETTRVFSFMGVPLSSSVLTFLEQHIGVDPSNKHINQRYMNTFRNAKFRHDHWKDELDSRTVEQIQDACLDVLTLLQYPVLHFPA